jgi:hypothetical protein
MTRRVGSVGAALAVCLSIVPSVVATTGAAAQDVASPVGGTPALFEGRWIDISTDWGPAAACDVQPDVIRCYRSEQEMDAALGTAPAPDVDAAALDAAASLCASSLRLYDGASFGGSVLQLSTRGVYLNLSTYGFDNVTSSYKVGACDSEFYTGASGSGLAYPGDTSAGAQAATMVFGWTNTVSSVYIS